MADFDTGAFVAEDTLTKKLQLCLKNDWNVLFIGRHGVGKSSIIKSLWDNEGLNYRMFSAATMDPWVDFLGVPARVEDKKTGKAYLKLIKPREFEDDEVEAILFDEFNRCLTGDTPIQLADGYSIPIKDLVDKKEFFVYSYDLKNKCMAVGRGHSARKTGKKQKVIKVTLDNGLSVRCTGDHPFLLTTGLYVKAGDLEPDDALMALYKKYNKNGYELVSSVRPTRWEFTYHLADKYNILTKIYKKSTGGYRHHKDKNRFNNSPLNIERLSKEEHIFKHASDGGKTVHEKYPLHYLRTIGNANSRSKAVAASIKTRQSDEQYKKNRSKISLNFWDKQKKNEQSQRAKKAWANGQFDNIDRVTANRKARLSYTIKILKTQLEEGVLLTPELYETIRSRIKNLAKNSRGKYLMKISTLEKHFGSFDNFVNHFQSEYSENKNHRVIKIEDAGYEDVYDITVDDYNNFAVGQGVFVHNSPKKIRNAVMELIQFKSINGREFKNLKVIWAAINPDDDEELDFDVEKLDPAQKDRFQIHIELKFEPSMPYFIHKYGKDVANGSIEWWKKLKKEHPDIITKVSPRRLDYALEIFFKGGNVGYALPKGCNPAELTKIIKERPIIAKLESLMVGKDDDKIKEFLENENNFDLAKHEILRDRVKVDLFVPFMPAEKINMLISQSSSVMMWALKNYSRHKTIKEALKEIEKADMNKALVSQIRKRFSEDGMKQISSMPDSPAVNDNRIDNYQVKKKETVSFGKQLDDKIDGDFDSTFFRIDAFNVIKNGMPNVMSKDTSIKVLTVLEKVIKMTHRDTVKKWTELPAMINTCIDNLKTHGYKFSKFKDSFPAVLAYAAVKNGFYFKSRKAS